MWADLFIHMEGGFNAVHNMQMDSQDNIFSEPLPFIPSWNVAGKQKRNGKGAKERPYKWTPMKLIKFVGLLREYIRHNGHGQCI